MSYIQDSWLDSLVKHPIFELNQQEKACTTYLKEGQTRQNPEVDFLLQHHNRVMAIRENDLFVAVGDQIRVLNLTEMKDTWMNASRDATERQIELTDSWIHSVPYKVKMLLFKIIYLHLLILSFLYLLGIRYTRN